MTYFITRSNAESLGWPKLMQLKNRETVWTKIKDKWTGKIEIRRKKFLAVGEACMAIFWPTPGSKGSLASNVHVVRKRLHFNNAHQESTNIPVARESYISTTYTSPVKSSDCITPMLDRASKTNYPTHKLAPNLPMVRKSCMQQWSTHSLYVWLCNNRCSFAACRQPLPIMKAKSKERAENKQKTYWVHCIHPVGQ